MDEDDIPGSCVSFGELKSESWESACLVSVPSLFQVTDAFSIPNLAGVSKCTSSGFTTLIFDIHQKVDEICKSVRVPLPHLLSQSRLAVPEYSTFEQKGQRNNGNLAEVERQHTGRQWTRGTYTRFCEEGSKDSVLLVDLKLRLDQDQDRMVAVREYFDWEQEETPTKGLDWARDVLCVLRKEGLLVDTGRYTKGEAPNWVSRRKRVLPHNFPRIPQRAASRRSFVSSDPPLELPKASHTPVMSDRGTQQSAGANHSLPNGGSHQAGRGIYPAKLNTSQANTGMYGHPVTLVVPPAFSGVHPTNMGFHPANQGAYPIDPGLLPAHQAVHPTHHRFYPANQAHYPTPPNLYPANPGVYSNNPVFLPPNAVYPSNMNFNPAHSSFYPVDPARYLTGANIVSMSLWGNNTYNMPSDRP